MKIGLIQASSQNDKNLILEGIIRDVIKDQPHELINFGIFEDDKSNLSYIQIACCIAMLIESHSVDFIITGCSSGQGMMLACNSLPGLLCGFIKDATDAYLFGRINNGNVISYPLGIQWGWAAEQNVKDTIRALFEEPFGIGYPKEDAERKLLNTRQLHRMNQLGKRSLIELLPLLDKDIILPALQYHRVYDYIMKYGTHDLLIQIMKELREYKGENNENITIMSSCI